MLVLLAALLTNNSCGESGVQSGDTDPQTVYTSPDGSLGNLTLDLTCAKRTITTSEVTPYSPTANKIIKVVITVYTTPLSVIGAFLNIFFIYLVVKHRKLQTLSFGIALQVVVVNILYSPYLFLGITTALAGEWVFGSHTCVIAGFLSITVLMLRSNLMFVLVIDRFLSVFCPYSYPRYKKKVAVCLSVITWVLVVVISVTFLPGILDCYGFVDWARNCLPAFACNEKCGFFGFSFFLSAIVPSTFVPLILYTTLYCKARSLRSSTPDEVGGSEEERSRERRATVTFFFLFMTLFGLIIPTTAVQAIIFSVFPPHQPLPLGLHLIVLTCGMIYALFLLTDAIAIMRHRDVREIVSEMYSGLKLKWLSMCRREN